MRNFKSCINCSLASTQVSCSSRQGSSIAYRSNRSRWTSRQVAGFLCPIREQRMATGIQWKKPGSPPCTALAGHSSRLKLQVRSNSAGRTPAEHRCRFVRVDSRKIHEQVSPHQEDHRIRPARINRATSNNYCSILLPGRISVS